MHRLLALFLVAATLSFAEPPKPRKPRAEDRDEVKPSKSAALQCPPILTLPEAWQACAVDSDCTLAGDACRTCGNFLPVNVRYKDDATRFAAAAAEKAQCVQACEACKLPLKLTCRAKMCSVVPPSR